MKRKTNARARKIETKQRSATKNESTRKGKGRGKIGKEPS